MSDIKNNEVEQEEIKGLSRRSFLGAGAVIGGVGLAAPVMTSAMFSAAATARTKEKMAAHASVAPGELDEYYGLWSGGQ